MEETEVHPTFSKVSMVNERLPITLLSGCSALSDLHQRAMLLQRHAEAGGKRQGEKSKTQLLTT